MDDGSFLPSPPLAHARITHTHALLRRGDAGPVRLPASSASCLVGFPLGNRLFSREVSERGNDLSERLLKPRHKRRD